MARVRRDPTAREPLSGMMQLFVDMALESGPRGAPLERDWTDDAGWEALWRESRDRLLADRSRPGTRPWAWWWLDAPEGPQFEEFPSDWERWLSELEFLAAIGELSDDELERLLSPRPAPWFRHGSVSASHPPLGVSLEAEVEAERDAVLDGLHERSTQPTEEVEDDG